MSKLGKRKNANDETFKKEKKLSASEEDSERAASGSDADVDKTEKVSESKIRKLVKRKNVEDETFKKVKKLSASEEGTEGAASSGSDEDVDKTEYDSGSKMSKLVKRKNIEDETLKKVKKLSASEEETERVASSGRSDEDKDFERNLSNNDDDERRHENEEDETPAIDSNMGVVASHYNELKELGRQERVKSRIFHMRNFNNWVKSQLINEYLLNITRRQRVGDPMRVLDMCCGKGGDLLKWEKAAITHLICTDIAEVSVEQCKRRYDDMAARVDKTKFAKKFSAEFFACDSTLVRLRERYKDPSLKLNLVSCQFAFHYSFESLSQADCMVRNAAECLQPGGYFIATIPDAYEIMRRLRASKNARSFGNDIFNIEFVSDTDPPPLFGAKYQFHLEGVVDCPEFLVHFPTLVKLCRKHGLKFERKTTFADYYKEGLENGRSLLQRMNGLETVYPNRVKSNDEEYAHLRNMLKSGNLSRPIGTLTKSEWEATTLYLVCAFRKCKNTWDAQGKPVFEFN